MGCKNISIKVAATENVAEIDLDELAETLKQELVTAQGQRKAKFIKRLVIGVAIFLVPSMLKLLLSIGQSVWPVIDADLCGIL